MTKFWLWTERDACRSRLPKSVGDLFPFPLENVSTYSYYNILHISSHQITPYVRWRCEFVMSPFVLRDPNNLDFRLSSMAKVLHCMRTTTRQRQSQHKQWTIKSLRLLHASRFRVELQIRPGVSVQSLYNKMQCWRKFENQMVTRKYQTIIWIWVYCVLCNYFIFLFSLQPIAGFWIEGARSFYLF